MKLVFATNNSHKLREIQNILGNKINLLSLNDIHCSDEVPENGTTLESNALEKAQYIYNKYHLDCFADDTGLEIEALNGEPGVYSARYAGEQKNPADNVKKVLSLMQGITNRKARFRCIIALIVNREEHLFEGIVNGTIISECHGDGGFGYDPIFIPDGYSQTFAQMPPDLKNRISHRAIAAQNLAAFLKKIK
jgi:XTP/dITP diphosphohydrolase